MSDSMLMTSPNFLVQLIKKGLESRKHADKNEPVTNHNRI